MNARWLAALAVLTLWPTAAPALSVNQVLELRKAGVGDATIKMMLDNELAAARQGGSGRYEIRTGPQKTLIIYRASSPSGQVDYPVEVVEGGASIDRVGVALDIPRRSKPASGGGGGGGGDGVTLQLRSYRDAAEARQYADRLRQRDIQAQVAQVDLGQKGVWHRVFVTGLADKATAEALGASLKKDGMAETYWIEK